MKVNSVADDAYTGWRLNLTKIVIRSTADRSVLRTIVTNNEAVLDTGGGDTVGSYLRNGKKQLFLVQFCLRYAEEIHGYGEQ